MKVPQTRYRIPTFYGDDNWHVVNRDDEDLSVKNPLSIYIGVTTEVSPSLGSFTKLQSNWVWRHTFNSRNSSNFWSSDSANGSNGSTNPQSMGLNISSGYNTVSLSNAITECYITSGSSASTKFPVSTIQFSSYNDWYFTPGITAPNLASNSAIVFKTAVIYIADLPTQMYSINNRTITWNLTHPVCILLYGQECFIA
jgi:hypothetical protein